MKSEPRGTNSKDCEKKKPPIINLSFPPDRHKDGVVEVHLLVPLLLPYDPLLPHQTGSKVDVDGQVDHLCVDQGHCNTVRTSGGSLSPYLAGSRN